MKINSNFTMGLDGFNYPNPCFDRRYNNHPTVIDVVKHNRNCPYCDRKSVDVYYSSQLDRYICENCMKILLGEENNDK